MRDGIEVYYPRYVSFPGARFFEHSGWFYYLGIRKTIKKIHQEFPFDIIHAHVALPDGFASTLLSRKYGRPLVMTIHGQDVCSCAPALPTIERNNACRKAVLDAFDHSDRLVAVSSRIARLLQQYHVPAEKIRVIANGVPLNRIQGTARVEQRENDGEKLLLSVGGLVERKGHQYIVEALPTLLARGLKLKYVIIGQGEYEATLKSLVNELNLEGQVVFLGQRGQEEVFRWMAQSELFVLPSWDEAFGVVYLEAMAHSLPVIGCRDQGLDDFVVDGESGLLVEPRDVTSVSEAIQRLLTDPDLARSIGCRGRQVVENFSWTVNVRKHLDLYRELLPSPEV